MNDINDKVYLISMIEILMNNNKETNLGKYALEYELTESIINSKEQEEKSATLALAVRLKDKEENKIVWGNIFHKILQKGVNPFSKETMAEIKTFMSKLNEKSEREKIDFIIRAEKKRKRKCDQMYQLSDYIDPRIAGFFENLQETKIGSPLANLGGRFPTDAISELDNAYITLIEKKEGLNL